MKFKKTIAAAFTTAGSMGTAASNFLLAAVLIPHLSPEDYGGYSFALVVTQLGFNVSNALTATPMSMDIAQGRLTDERLSIYASASLFVCAIISVFVFLNLFINEIDAHESILMAAVAFTALLRWYGRTYCFNVGRRHVALLADFAYAVVLSLGAGYIFWAGSGESLSIAAIAILISNLLSTVIFIKTGFFSSFKNSVFKGLREYIPIFRVNSSWSLVLVLISEAAVNAHVYLVIYIKGLEAYAPLALALLCWRPFTTVISAMGQSERPYIASVIRSNDNVLLRKGIRWFRFVLISAFLVNLISLIIIYNTDILNLIGKYNVEDVALAVCLFAVMMFARAVRVPDTIVCQAAGATKSVAILSWYAAPVSVILAFVILWLEYSPAMSLIAVAIGDIVMMVGTSLIAKSLIQKIGR